MRPKKRIGLAFGSYGWGCLAVKEIEAVMNALGWHVPFEGIDIQYIPDEAELQKVKEVGKQLGRSLKS